MNPKNAKLAWQLTFEGAWPMSVAFIGSGQRLAAGNRDGQFYVWDLPDKPIDATAETDEKKNGGAANNLPPARKLDGHENGVTRLISSPDGKTLISASLDHTVRLWQADAPASGSVEVVMDIKARKAAAKKARKDDALKKPGIMVETQSAAHVLDEHGDWVNGLSLSRDNKRLISGDDNGLVIVRDLATRKEITRWTGYPGNWVTSAALTADGQTAFVGEYCGRRGDFDRPPAQAKVFNATDGKMLVDILAVQFPKVKKRDNSYGYARTWGKFVKRGFIAADFSPDGKLLAVGQAGETDTGKVHLLDPTTGKVVRTVSGHRYGVTDVKFSVDGKFILSVGRDTTLRICKVDDGKEVAALGKSRGGQFKDWFSAVAISPNQQWIAAADIAGIIHVWHLPA